MKIYIAIKLVTICNVKGTLQNFDILWGGKWDHQGWGAGAAEKKRAGAAWRQSQEPEPLKN